MKIRTVNTCMMVITFMLCLFLLKITFDVSKRHEALLQDTNRYIHWIKGAATIREASDYLTEQVRLFTQTLDKRHMVNFFQEVNETQRRDAVLRELTSYYTNKNIVAFMSRAVQSSNALIHDESYAMKLICTAMDYKPASIPAEVQRIELSEEDAALDDQAMIQKARQLLFNEHYRATKALIYSHISHFLQGLVDDLATLQKLSTEKASLAIALQRISILLLVFTCVLLFVTIVSLVIKPIDAFIRSMESFSLLPLSGADEFKALAKSFNDIRESYAISASSMAKYRTKAEHDTLTQTINRDGFTDMSNTLKKDQRAVAFALIDVDNFKKINDSYGYEIGDRVLKKVANCLRRNFPSRDYLFHLGGDEFAVLILEMEAAQYEIFEKRIAKINALLQEPDDGLPVLSISVGVAFSSRGYQDGLYTQADQALYQAKKQGRSGCTCYTPDTCQISS